MNAPSIIKIIASFLIISIFTGCAAIALHKKTNTQLSGYVKSKNLENVYGSVHDGKSITLTLSPSSPINIYFDPNSVSNMKILNKIDIGDYIEFKTNPILKTVQIILTKTNENNRKFIMITENEIITTFKYLDSLTNSNTKKEKESLPNIKKYR